MNLQSAAEGILETHVTWEEVEKKMQNALNTTAKFGKNKNVVHIGDGNVGFQMNKSTTSNKYLISGYVVSYRTNHL